MNGRRLPPGPKDRFLIGNFPLASREPLKLLESWARQYGDIFYYRLFHLPVYFLNHPDYLEYVLVTNSGNFIKGRGLQGNRLVFGNGLLTSEGDFWLRQRRAASREGSDLLSLLLHAQDEDGSRMTDQQLRDEALTLFLAGHETTAIALSWIWCLLAQHSEVEQKLLAELGQVLGGRTPTAADLPGLPYTEMVVKESLRLYPPAYAMARIALHECEIGGYRVPPGASVVMSQWVMHRDPRYYDEPERFNPDRWANGLEKRLPKFAYFPFGGGPRQCIGNSFAMMEAMLLLATVAQKFRLRLAPGHPVAPFPSITLRPKHGIKVLLSKR